MFQIQARLPGHLRTLPLRLLFVFYNKVPGPLWGPAKLLVRILTFFLNHLSNRPLVNVRMAAIVECIEDMTADILLSDRAAPRLGFGDELEQANLAFADIVRFTAPDQALAEA